MLDEFQRVWQRYDKPIVDICSAMLKHKREISVIDIGANVGDTAAAICYERNAQVLAIEGNPAFLPYLRHNVGQIGPSVTVEECFIGNSGETVTVKTSTNPGTASVSITSSESEQSFSVKSIEEITSIHPFFSNPDLVKIDTDGSDFPIIAAMKSWLQARLPTLFFEFDPSFSPTGVEDGLNAIHQLSEIGYKHFIVFDNYGNPLCEIESDYLRRFEELCNWLESHRKYGARICYLDVLAVESSQLPWLADLRAFNSTLSRNQSQAIAGKEIVSQPDTKDNKPICRLCHSPTETAFSRPLMLKYTISYFKCTACGSLQTETPYWLNEAYSKKKEQFDTGKVSRTLINFFILRSFLNIIGIRSADRCADFGGGTGLFTRLMRDIGFNFYSYDKYGSGEFCADYCWEKFDKSAKLVTIFECAEHFENPDIEWDTIFSSSSDYILGSTELYSNQNADWNYLAPETGQHIFFYSDAAIAHLASKRGWQAYTVGSYFLLSRIPLSEQVRVAINDWYRSLGNACNDTFKTWLENPLKFALIDNVKITERAKLRSSNTLIAVDGFFLRYSTGIARLWKSLLAEWTANGFGEFLVVIDRARTSPRLAGIRYLDASLHNYEDLESDRKMLQEICDRENITFFISTYYTTPLSTPAALMIPDMIPEVMGFDLNFIHWQEKHAAIRYCRDFLAISNSTANDLIRFFPEIAPERVITAYCGTDHRTPSAEQVASFKQRHGIDRPYFLVPSLVTGARKGMYKNLELFFEAFALLDEHRGEYAILCTHAPQELSPEFQECVGEAKVYLMVLTDDDLQCAYAGAAALAYPSRYEGFGLPVLEAMACSCPVITCNNSSIGEVAGDAAIYVGPDDKYAMRDALLAVQKEPVRSELIQKGLLRAENFSWRKMADTVESALIKFSQDRTK